MSCANDRAVVFVIERGTTEIDQPYIRPFYTFDLLPLKKKKLLSNTSNNDTLSYTLLKPYLISRRNLAQ